MQQPQIRSPSVEKMAGPRRGFHASQHGHRTQTDSAMLLLVLGLLLVAAAVWRWGHLASYLYQFLLVRSFTNRFARGQNNNVWRALEERVLSDPSKLALRFEGQSWTFRELRRESVKSVHFFFVWTWWCVPTMDVVSCFVVCGRCSQGGRLGPPEADAA